MQSYPALTKATNGKALTGNLTKLKLYDETRSIQKGWQGSGRVSVWIGNLISDVELDDYVNMQRTFEKDFGFEINEQDMPETKVEEKPVPIAELVEGFSWAEAYAESVSELAKAQGVERATTMIIFINFEYDPERAKPNPNAQVKFLGAVNFNVPS